jgi:hypothetical protein
MMRIVRGVGIDQSAVGGMVASEFPKEGQVLQCSEVEVVRQAA